MIKRLFMILVVVGMIMAFGLEMARSQSEEKIEGAKFEVTITIVYNSVDREKIKEIVDNVAQIHNKACKIDFVIKKNDIPRGYMIYQNPLINIPPRTQNN